jgi:hypothetical protein
MLVTLCISNDNLMILWTLLPVALSWGIKQSSLQVCWNYKELTNTQFEITPKTVHLAPYRTWILPSSRWHGFIPPLDYPCQVCQRTEDADQMLLCDNYNGGYHLFCFKPKLIQIPISIWYCSSCSPTTPWFLLRLYHVFFNSSLGEETWEFHLNLLLCIVYICACISFWLISFHLWLVLVFLFIRVYYAFTPLRHRTSRHYMSGQYVSNHYLVSNYKFCTLYGTINTTYCYIIMNASTQFTWHICFESRFLVW